MSCNVLRSILLVYLALCGLYVLPAWTSGGLPLSVTSMTETLLFTAGAGCAGAAMLQQAAGHRRRWQTPIASGRGLLSKVLYNEICDAYYLEGVRNR